MSTRRSATPTLADVAAEVGVSQATASRALADSPLVNENTRRRVWEAAERLRFEPNRLARSLRRGATMAVGLVVPDVAAAFYATALKGAQDTLEAAGYHVLVLSTGRAAEREREALRTLRAHQVDGLIVATSGGYEDIGVPAVFFDNVPRLPRRRRGGDGQRGRASGCSSSTSPACTATSGSPTWGRRRPSGPAPTTCSRASAASGWRRSAPRSGAPASRCRPSTCAPATAVAFEEDARVAAGELARARASRPRRWSAATDTLATGLLRGLREHGLRVPEDVALVSFDEPRLRRPARPADDVARPPRQRARPDRGRDAAAGAPGRRRRGGPHRARAVGADGAALVRMHGAVDNAHAILQTFATA